MEKYMHEIIPILDTEQAPTLSSKVGAVPQYNTARMENR